MAITVNDNPDTFSPAYNDIAFVVTSDNTAQDNFKYIADLYINGVKSIRLRNSPDPTYGSAEFNIGRSIETYVSSDISKSDIGFTQNLNSYVYYSVHFGEQYGPSSGIVTYEDLTTTSTRYVYNGIIDWLDYQSYTSLPYVLAQATSNQFLTNAPAIQTIRDNEDAWLYMMTNTSGTIYYMDVATYDSSNSLIQTVRVENPYQAVSSFNHKFLRFPTGTHNLSLIPSSGVVSGSLPIITGSVSKYTLTVKSYSNQTNSETKTYKVDSTCTKNNTYRFHFLNKLGGYDSYTFIGGNKRKVDITKNTAKRITGGLISATAWGYNKTDRGDIQNYTSLKDNIRVQSDWITSGTCAWLEELITSPNVYLDDPTHGLIAVTIKNSTYDLKTELYEKMFNIEIEFEYSFNRYRQRQ